MNGTRTTAAAAALGHTEIPDEADWALAGVTDGVNATGLLADDLEEYGGLTEIQTLILACVATFIPLFLGLLLILGVRMVWKKYKNHNTNSGYDNDGMRREDSCDAVKSSSFMQSAEELKASESQYSVLMPDDAVCCHAADASTLPPLLYNSPPNNRFGDTNKTNLNGSIITLTMKNNHLIVETEERVPGGCAVAGEATAAAAAAATAADRPADYEYDDDDDNDDDDEFDVEAEMLRREFREASLLANGVSCGGPVGSEPNGRTRADPTAGRLQQPAAAADHSSGGSSSADSRAAETAYAYGNQCEYTADDGCKHGYKAAVKSTAAPSPAAVTNNNNNNNNNHNHNHNHAHNHNHNDDEYMAEQRLLGNGADAGDNNNCPPDGERTVAAAVQ